MRARMQAAEVLVLWRNLGSNCWLRQDGALRYRQAGRFQDGRAYVDCCYSNLRAETGRQGGVFEVSRKTERRFPQKGACPAPSLINYLRRKVTTLARSAASTQMWESPRLCSARRGLGRV